MLNEEFSERHIEKQLVAALMRCGKRSKAEGILRKAFMTLKEQGVKPLVAFKGALNNSAPSLEVVGRIRARSTVLVPRPIRTKRRLGIAVKWIVEGARARTESSMSERLAFELLGLSKGQGNAIRQRIALHQLAFAKKGNGHLR